MTPELMQVRGAIFSLDDATRSKVLAHAQSLTELLQTMGTEGQIALALVVAELDAKQRGES